MIDRTKLPVLSERAQTLITEEFVSSEEKRRIDARKETANFRIATMTSVACPNRLEGMHRNEFTREQSKRDQAQPNDKSIRIIYSR